MTTPQDKPLFQRLLGGNIFYGGRLPCRRATALDIGWRPREDFESGLAKTMRWFCDNRTWWQNILDGGYRSARIGLG
jgi:nucleoside-diphosphate-sugar epimerase